MKELSFATVKARPVEIRALPTAPSQHAGPAPLNTVDRGPREPTQKVEGGELDESLCLPRKHLHRAEGAWLPAPTLPPS